ncbi:hypothetical protein RSAG8_02240, partial [Rhizoctonia solani AG-8 WAC10335]
MRDSEHISLLGWSGSE